MFAQKIQLPSAVNKGEILLTNWNPELEQDAAQINQLTLKYAYSIYNSQPVGRYNLQWTIGNYINYHQKRWTRNEVSEEMFSNLAIKSVRLKADVFSEGKYVTNVFINFPDVSIKSGSSLTPAIISNMTWNNVFERTYSKESQGIFQDGFELRNIYIFEIEFEGFDFPEDTLKTNIPEEKTQKNIDYNQPSQLEKSKNKNKKTLKYYFMNDFSKGKKNSFRGLSYHASINLDFNYLTYPLVLNSYSYVVFGNSVATDSDSYKKSVGGLHFLLGGEYWPVFGNFVGVGLAANAGLGGLPNLFTSYLADLTLKFYFGAKEVKLLFEAAKVYRVGEYYHNTGKIFDGGFSNSDIYGLGDFRINRIGIGPRFSWKTVRRNYPFENKSYYPFDLDVMILFDWSNNFLNKRNAMVWKINLWFYNYFSMVVEYSPDYPVGGKQDFPLDNEFKNSGTYLSITVGKKIDFFGRPYLKKKK